MVNLMLSCGRCVKTELFRSEKTVRILQRNVGDKKIIIPPRINRGPLDILQALAGTVQNEAGVVEYRLQYGGIFNSYSNHLRRVASLSMDSGRKAAKWVVTENPKLFQHKYADPYIKAFAPPKLIDDNTDPSEVMLLESIEDIQVENAIKLYTLMKEKNIDVSTNTKQILLEMVCYFNGKNKPDITLIDSKHYEFPREVTFNTWDNEGFAEKLFLDMEPNRESYTALILGRIMYKSITNGIKLYEEAKEKGIQFGVEVYNALLENVSTKKFEYTEQEAYIIELLKEMKEKNIHPNLGTLNSILISVNGMKSWAKARNLAANVYQEFRSIGIKPSLATYYHLMEIFSHRRQAMPAFEEILEEVANNSFVAVHRDDFKFFNRAMEIATYHFKSLPLSHKVYQIYQTGNNRCFVVGNVNHTNYHRTYLSAAFRYGDLDEAVDLFERFVPQAYVPEAVGTLTILECLKNNNGWTYLPRIWPLIQDFALRSEKTCPMLLAIIVKGMTSSEKEKLIEIAMKVWESNSNNKVVIRDFNNLSLFLEVFALGGDKNLSHEIFTIAVTFGAEIGSLKYESLKLYTDVCISNKEKKKALMCVEYAILAGYQQARSLAENVQSNIALSKEEEKLIEEWLKKFKSKASNSDENESETDGSSPQ